MKDNHTKQNYLNMPYGKERDKVIEETINKRIKELKKPKPKISYFAFPGIYNIPNYMIGFKKGNPITVKDFKY